ncbi:MAG: hypothetical protein ACD_13C00246G0001 [uncultured bacterium]|nr:MAG: hypothetical protein ACD_13C00246G0001 [uncultured bacterium]
MFVENFRKFFLKDLSTTLRMQIRSHQESRYSFHNNIICGLSEGSGGICIYATLKSNDPSKGFHTNQQIIFYRFNVGSIEEGINQLTTEVSQAKIRFNKFDFFRSLTLPLADATEYKTQYDKLHDFEKVKMISRGINCSSKTLIIYEIYTLGGWNFYNSFPWHTPHDDGDETDEHGEFRI